VLIVTDVKGEQIRRNLTEGEGGVHMTIDIQVVDVKTCKPLTDVAIDFWSCNSTVGPSKATAKPRC
jgi:protocatechuate 3,4-dioxygenase beta subunit